MRKSSALPTHPHPTTQPPRIPTPPPNLTTLQIFERYAGCHPTQRAYLKYAKWEEKQIQVCICVDLNYICVCLCCVDQ